MQPLKRFAAYLRASLHPHERRHALVGPPRLWKMKRAFQVEFLKQEGLKPNNIFFEIGCGTLRGGIPIIQYLEPRHYFGFEVSAERLGEGRKELRQMGLEMKRPTLLQAPDITQINIDQQFDFMWAFSVLIHLTDSILADVIAFVSDHLAHDGAFYANVNVGIADKGRWREFPVVARPLDFYRETCFAKGLAVIDLGPLVELGHVSGRPSHDQQRLLRIIRSTEDAQT